MRAKALNSLIVSKPCLVSIRNASDRSISEKRTDTLCTTHLPATEGRINPSIPIQGEYHSNLSKVTFVDSSVSLLFPPALLHLAPLLLPLCTDPHPLLTNFWSNTGPVYQILKLLVGVLHVSLLCSMALRRYH